MKVTFIAKHLSEDFYEGGSLCKGLHNMTPMERFRKLDKMAHDPSWTRHVKQKIGSGQFRDKVELNQLLRNPQVNIEYKIEPRKGYKLITFLIG